MFQLDDIVVSWGMGGIDVVGMVAGGMIGMPFAGMLVVTAIMRMVFRQVDVRRCPLRRQQCNDQYKKQRLIGAERVHTGFRC